jgi:hypothetical protein
VTGSYTADIIDVPSHGIRLRPEHGADVPRAPGEQNLLALAIALALGAAGYEHHPEPRDPGLQTIDALLEGHTTAPWRASRTGGGDGDGDSGGPPAGHAVVCQRSKSAVWSCHVEDR